MLKINRDVIIAIAVICLMTIIVAIKAVWWALPTMVALPLVVLAHNVNYAAVVETLKRRYSYEESLAYAALPAVIIDRIDRMRGGLGGCANLCPSDIYRRSHPQQRDTRLACWSSTR